MEALTQHWVAVAALLAYTAVLLHNAYLGRSRTNNVADYYIGGRRLGGAVLGVSYFATFASTNSYIGHAGKGYSYGAPWLIMVAFIVVFTYLSWRFVAPRMRRFTAAWGAVTLPDYLVARFGAQAVGPSTGVTPNLLRVTSGLVIVLCSLLYIIAVFKGAGGLFQQFLGVDYHTAVGITLLIVVLYTAVGGFHSVVRTDVLQGVLMLLGAVAIFWCVTRAAGGIGAVFELKAEPATAPLFTLNGGLPLVVLLGIALAGSLKLMVDPRQLSRFYGLKDERSVRVGLWVAVLGIAIIQLCLFPVGLYAHKLLVGVTDTDLIVPTLLMDPAVFPLWLSDLLMVAILAAAMSSMDSVLLVAASVGFHDVVASYRNPVQDDGPNAAISWTRVLVVIIAVVGAVLALNPPGGIVEITIFSGSLYAVCFLPAVLLGLHWQRGSAGAVVVSMLCGVGVLFAWMLSGAGAWLHEVFPALLTSTTVYVLMSLIQAPAIQQWPDTPDSESHA